MEAMTFHARLYNNAMLLTGAVLLMLQLGDIGTLQRHLDIVVLSLFAAVTQVFKIEGASRHISHQLSWFVFGLTFALYDAPQAILVISVAHLVDWLWNRYPWHVSAFALAKYVSIITLIDIAIYEFSDKPLSNHIHGANAGIWLIAAAVAFTLGNHLIDGIGAWLVNGENFAHSGIFQPLGLGVNLAMFAVGEATKFTWLSYAYWALLIAVPLYFILRSLKVPSLERQVQTDPKTGLYNARYFRERLESEIQIAQRRKRPLTVIMADMDDLRLINNRFGHVAGDAVIIGIADVLKQSVRKNDVVSRFGGEEFAILMPGTTMQEALPLVEYVRYAIEAASFSAETHHAPLRVTMSFGVTSVEGEALEEAVQSVEQITHSADQAVYSAKAYGKNRVFYFHTGGLYQYSRKK